MGIRKDLIGQVFNRWTVVLFSEYREEKTWWLCRCVCGVEKEVEAGSLVSGHSKSCGCLNSESVSIRNRLRKLPNGVASFNTLYYRYQKSSKKRSILFRLSEEEFLSLTKKPCHYCEATPLQVSTNCGRTSTYVYNGVDRVDNSVGYIKENCVPCCKVCNRAKSDLPLAEFLAWIDRLVKFRNGDAHPSPQPEGPAMSRGRKQHHVSIHQVSIQTSSGASSRWYTNVLARVIQ